MRVYFYVFVLFFSGMSIFPQGTGEISDLLKNAEENIYVNPNESIRILEQILKTTNNSLEITNAHLYLSRSFFITGNYKKSIEHFFDAKNTSAQIGDNNLNIEVLTHGVTLFNFLNFLELVNQLELEIKTIPGESAYYTKYKKWLEADSLKDTKVLKEMIPLNEAKDDSEKFALQYLESRILNSLAKSLTSATNSDTTQMYFKKALNKAVSVQKNNFFEMQLLLDYSLFLFEIKEYQKAINTLILAEEISLNFKNAFYEKKIFELLAQSYLIMDVKDKFQEYFVKANNASTASLAQENIAINTIFNVLQNKQNIEKGHLVKISSNTLLFYGAGLFLTILIWLFIKWFATMKLNHTKDHIKYLKLIKDFDKKEESPIKTNIKTLGIPKETENTILLKLEKFEKGNKYISRDMSLA
ncbi:MAG: hypothetical protein H0X63_00885, partial [Flavobacteriales bacterium]|nr:hypothetical protein [Flavobacteriales bacterium]